MKEIVSRLLTITVLGLCSFAVIQGAFYGISAPLLTKIGSWIADFQQTEYWMFGGEDTNFAYLTQNHTIKPHPFTSLFPLKDNLKIDQYDEHKLKCTGWLHKLTEPKQHYTLAKRLFKLSSPGEEALWCLKEENGWWIERSVLLQEMQSHCSFSSELKGYLRSEIKKQKRTRERRERRMKKATLKT